MRRLLFALLLSASLLPRVGVGAAEDPADPPEPAGIWRGELDSTGGARPKPVLVLHIRHGREGYVATLDGLGANLRHLKVESLTLVEDVLSFQVPEVNARFAGNFYGDSLRGTWTQGDEPRSLIFYRD